MTAELPMIHPALKAKPGAADGLTMTVTGNMFESGKEFAIELMGAKLLFGLFFWGYYKNECEKIGDYEPEIVKLSVTLVSVMTSTATDSAEGTTTDS